MDRAAVIAHALDLFDREFIERLGRRVAIPTESEVAARAPELRRYIEAEIAPDLARLGFASTLHPNPSPRGGPFLIARRIEGAGLPTLLTYGHGDVVAGMEGRWQRGRSPWRLDRDGDRLYGRGTADNKGQHTLNLMALEAVLAARGRLGFNTVVLLETSEEVGSPGIQAFCAEHRDALAADVLIASDGPRLSRDRPTLFFGARGVYDIDVAVVCRDGGHHSGNWGGLLTNPAVRLVHALATLTDAHGRALVRELVPEAIPVSIRRALADCPIEPGPDGPAIDDAWGEPGLSRAEKVFAWNAVEILTLGSGDPDAPVNAIPPSARARVQIRHTPDRDPAGFIPAIRRHFDRLGFGDVRVTEAPDNSGWAATRMDPDEPWPRFVADSVRRTTGAMPARLPSLGGSLPNDAFAHGLGLPTVYIPHSYAGCSQHAPDEHGLVSLFRDGMAIMAGLFADLGQGEWPGRRQASA